MTACPQHLGTLSPRELRRRQFRLADWMMAYRCGNSGGRNQCPEDAMCKILWMCSRERFLDEREAEMRLSYQRRFDGGLSCDQHGHLIYAWKSELMWVAAIQDYDWCSELLGRPKLDRSNL